MNDRIPCDMIQDLLPLYVDGLTHETTTQEIERQLQQCSRCRESHEQMKGSLGARKEELRQETDREIRYLRKLKRKNIRNIAAGIGVAVLVMALILGAKIFFIGSPSDSWTATYLEVRDGQIYVGGAFFDSASVYAGHKLVRQPDGTQKLVVCACLASDWNRKGVFNLILDLSGIESQADIGGATVMRDGSVVSAAANRLYAARNPYIGDASADGRLAGALRIGDHMGSFTNELQTTSEPYGWTLNFQDSIRNPETFEAQMRDYACVLLALTDNLGQMSWTYTAETETGTVKRQGTMTEQEASQYLGEPVKSFGESPGKLQELLELIRLP